MPWLRSFAILAVAFLLGGAGVLAQPEPPQARANVVCDPPVPDPGDVVDAVGDAVGVGNPVGDACEAVTDPILGLPGKALDPLKDAASELGKGVFNQVTSWVADGAVWLVGEIARGIDKTTRPNLLSKGFLHQYKLMGQIAALMAALMLIFVVLEALARGELSLLWRVFLVNVPLAAIATSVAYVVVQLLLATSDGMGEAIAQTTSADSRKFFRGTIEALAAVGASSGAVAGASAGGTTGAAAGAVAVPLFIGFIAAVVMALAALFVWIELLMRDAAIYVVSLFMPLALAAAIWPRWGSALRRTCELLIVIIFSKFVIVAIISLAASLVTRGDGSVEHVLAAATMLLIACFAPFVLFKLVPFAEGAIGSAYHRQSAGGGALQAVQVASSVQMMRRAAMANWAAGASGKSGRGGGGGGGASGGGGKGKLPAGGGGGSSGGAGASGGAAAGAGGAAGAAGVAAMPAAAGASAAKAAKGGAEKLAGTGVAGAAGSGSAGGSESASKPAAGMSRSSSHRSPQTSVGAGADGASEGTSEPVAGSGSPPQPRVAAEPSEPKGGEAPRAGGKPARPGGGDGVAGGAKGGGAA